MANTSTGTGLQLRSTVKKNGTLDLSLASVSTPEPKLAVTATISPAKTVAFLGGTMYSRYR